MRKQFTIFLILVFVFGLAPVNFSNAADLARRLKGRILLQVEGVGQAWYIDPETKERAFLGRPADAFRIMRELGLGISEDNYNSFNGYAPNRLSGKILLRVEANGEAYYVFPDDFKMHYLGRPADAFDIMREKGLGITDDDLNKVPVFEKYKEQVKENTQAIEQNTEIINELSEQLNEQKEIISQLKEQQTETPDETDSPPTEESIVPAQPAKLIAPVQSAEPTTSPPNIPTSIIVSANKSAIHKKGDAVDIVATVKDISGNPAPNQIVIFENGYSSVEVITNSDGVANVCFIGDYNSHVWHQTNIIAKVLVPTEGTFIQDEIMINAPIDNNIGNPLRLQQGYLYNFRCAASLDFPISDTKVALESSGFKISWQSYNFPDNTICNASGDWSGNKSISGSENFSYTEEGNYTYALICSDNSDFSITKSLQVEVISFSGPINVSLASDTPSGGNIIRGSKDVALLKLDFTNPWNRGRTIQELKLKLVGGSITNFNGFRVGHSDTLITPNFSDGIITFRLMDYNADIQVGLKSVSQILIKANIPLTANFSDVFHVEFVSASGIDGESGTKYQAIGSAVGNTFIIF